MTAEALTGLDAFSHGSAVRLRPGACKQDRHRRQAPAQQAWPSVGIFAQRGKNRPNRIGSTICRVLAVEGTTLRVAELDAIDGTPVIDIKPVLQEFLPRQATMQPAWATELMANYWSGTP